MPQFFYQNWFYLSFFFFFLFFVSYNYLFFYYFNMGILMNKHNKKVKLFYWWK